MKSFKSYIIESSEAPYAFYASKHGKIILPTSKPLKRNYIDHAYIPLTQPEDFGLTHKAMNQLHDLDDAEMLKLYSHGEAGALTGLHRSLAKLGYFRTSGYTNRDKNSNKPLHSYTISAYDEGHISDLQDAVRALREAHPHHGEDVNINIYGIKSIEPHELHPDIQKVLKPEHLETLFDRGSIEFKNTEDIDRFVGLGSRIGRDPGSGVQRIPSPQEMMDKMGEGDPNEPISIRRGRFFQSDSYQPNSKNYIAENEEQPTTMGHLITLGTNMKDADFWITRRGSIDKIGHPTKEYNPEHFGVKVTRTDLLDPRYAYYMFQHLATSGHFRQFADGATNLVNIRANHITDIPIR